MTFRRHGFEWPLHPLQCLAWIGTLSCQIILYLLAMPFWNEAWRPILLSVEIAVHALFVMAMIHASVSDPCQPYDPIHRDRRPSHTSSVLPDDKSKKCMHCFVFPFKRSAVAPLLTDSELTYYCPHCQSNVTPSAKHCRPCNKCVSGFDHHCIWLNTCVGSRNYSAFLICVVTAGLCGAVSVAALILALLNKLQEQIEITDLDAGWFTAIGFALLCYVSMTVFALQLLLYHAWLRFHGLTTYAHILQQREPLPAPVTTTLSE